MSPGEKFDWGIRAGFAIPMQGGVHVETDFFLGVRRGEIAFAGPFKKNLQAKSKKFLNAPGKALLPGLVNGHTHLAMTLFRGLEDDVPLKTWLFERIFPLESQFVSADFVKTGTELAALECIRFGTTTVSEMYFYPQVAIQVWDKAGLRGIFGQAMMDFPLPEDKVLGPDRFGRFDQLYRKYADHERIQVSLAPHAPYTCNDELLKKVAEKSRETGALIHIHMSESPSEVSDSKAKLGKSPVEHLESLGVLGPRTVCAHAVNMSENDRKIMKRTGARVVHNPDSNLKLGSGVAPIAEYLREGVPVALGTDGSASNNDLSLFGAMDLATKVQKLTHGDNTAMTAAQALWMATQGGAEALGLQDQIGSLEVGKRADFILVDFEFPHLQPVYDPVSHLVYATQGLEVDTVFCQGRPLLKDKKFTTMKPAAIFKKAAAYRKKIASHLENIKAGAKA
jgi:5-methylthioadenosine/S-adenosylhomocysteine deaminase